MVGRGRGRGRGRGTGSGAARPPVGRRGTRANPNHEAETPVVTEPVDANPQNEMEGSFARMLQAAIPAIATEIRRQEREGNGNHSGAGNHTGGETGPIGADDVGQVAIPIAAERRDVRRRGCDYKTFKSCDPKPFDGKQDAATTHQWLREMEAVIKISECDERQKVKFATHSLVSEALFWWDSI